MTVMTENTSAQKTQSLTDRIRPHLTRLNLYYAGVALLALLNLYLLIHIAFAWSAAHSRNEAALEQQRIALKTSEIASKPLEGLDAKLATATDQADDFYQTRLPYAYSQIAAELGALAKKQNVKMTHVQYAQAPVLQDGNRGLTEVRIDASMTGDYRPLVLFVNSLFPSPSYQRR